MQTCFFVPGIAGTELFYQTGFPQQAWVSYTTMLTGQMTDLGLATDGVSPSPFGGKALVIGGPLPDYYGSTISVLQAQLSPLGWQVVPWGYDFRLSLLSTGALLAAAVQATATPQSPCVIVAASGGGLVARVAYSILVAAGQGNLLQRLITLGTPHQGSYAAVQLFTGESSVLFGIAVLGFLSSLVAPFEAPLEPYSATSVADLVKVIATWPAYYQIMPFLGSVDNVTDPNRPKLYTANNWQGVQLSQNWLNLASETFDPLMAQPSSLPPAWQLTTFAGSNLSTADTLLNPSKLGTIYAYGSVLQGDGAVTVASAIVPASWQYVLAAAHNDIPFAAAQSGVLASEVTAIRGPTTPVPGQTVEGNAMVYTLAGPPIPLVGMLAYAPARFGFGDP
jgi:hypothetical protein